MLAKLSGIDKVSIVGLSKSIEAEEKTNTISGLAQKLNISLMSELRNREKLVQKIIAEISSSTINEFSKFKIFKDIVAFLMERSGAHQLNNNRKSYAPWFKEFIISIKELNQITYSELSDLTSISVDTLMGFKSNAHIILQKKPIDTKSEIIACAWNNASPWNKKSLDTFWAYLGKTYCELSISFKEMRQILINLGLRYPRGPKIENHGTRVKRNFSPHALWEGDAKQIKIIINNKEFVYSWYAFIDQRITLLVGSNIGKQENSDNFLAALKDGGRKIGLHPIGILIDNRLSDTDLSPIREFCKEHNIEIVRTFPGNSKSNGNIENNFSIFERFVGDININGTTMEEIASGVANAFIEVFTQQRNHSPRKRMAGRTPMEANENVMRPELHRNAIEKLAKRFEKKNENIEDKWKLISRAQKHFGCLNQESILKIQKILSKHTVKDIIAAQAAYLAQISKHPDNAYGSEYFFAILRHKRETKVKRTYNEAFRAGVKVANDLFPSEDKTESDCADFIIEELIKIQAETTPSLRMLKLDAIAWWMVGYGSKNSLQRLWRLVGDLVEKNLSFNLNWWLSINEFLYEKIGNLLFIDSPKGKSTYKNYNMCLKKINLGHYNLSSSS